MSNRRLIILLLLGGGVLLAGLLTLIAIRRDAVLAPDPPISASVPEITMVATVSVGRVVNRPEATMADPRYDTQEEARVAKRIEEIIKATPLLSTNDLANPPSEAVVTQEAGLRRMAESTGMPFDEQTLQPKSREAFMQEAENR